MKLIDADARVTVQSFDPMNEEYNQDEMTVEQALDFATDDGCPPTIDAIPVEWLNNVMLTGDAEESKAAWRMLHKWNDEHLPTLAKCRTCKKHLRVELSGISGRLRRHNMNPKYRRNSVKRMSIKAVFQDGQYVNIYSPDREYGGYLKLRLGLVVANDGRLSHVRA